MFRMFVAEYLHIIMILLGLLIVVTVSYMYDAYGLTRDDIKNTSSQINSLESELKSIDIRISEQKITIASNESAVTKKKDELREAKRVAGKSYAAVENIDAVQQSLINAEKSLSASKEKLIILLNQKSDIIKHIAMLKDQLKNDKKLLAVSSKPSLTHLTKLVGIQLSKQCITMLKNGYETTCPTYKQLREFDSSVQEVSGKFHVKDGFYQRGSPILKNSWRYYDSDPTIRIIVDPPLGMSDRIKMITIQNNFDIYLLPESSKMKQDYQIINQTKAPDQWGINSTYSGLNKTVTTQVYDNTASRIVFHDRYVDAKCKNAVINADIWKLLIADTIHYMRNDCNESYTGFITKEIISTKFTEQDISTSQKYKDEQYLKWIKEFCIFKYNVC